MSPRDGLQVVNREARVPLEERVALVTTLQAAGLPYIEAGAFVSPSRVPAMADTAELVARCAPWKGELAALVPNRKHYARFAGAPNVNTVALFVSASEAYSIRNTRMNVGEAIAAATDVARLAVADGYRVRAHVSGAFRDPIETDTVTEAADVLRVCEQLRAAVPGMVIALADTAGTATEEDIERVCRSLETGPGLDGIGVHLHDRQGTALPNARRAWELGVRIFDAAVGGIGGNPTALEDAVGNVPTEALVVMFEDMGIDTGLDLERLIDAGALVTSMTRTAGDPPPPSCVLSDALTRREDKKEGKNEKF